MGSDRMGRCQPNENWCESTRECVGEGLTCPACTDRLHVFCGQDNFDIKGNRRCCENKEICSQTTNPDNNPYKTTIPRMRNRRSQMKAQLKERIESDKQELAALDALEIDVSEEQETDEETEGVKETTSGTMCKVWSTISGAVARYEFCPSHKCCENGDCFHKKKDWIGVYYCPSECRGGPWKGHGTC